MGRPIRILHVCTIFLTVRTFIAQIVRHLISRDYKVAVVCSVEDSIDGPEPMSVYNLLGCQLYTIPISRTIQPLKDIRAVWALFRLIKQFRPDILHTQTSKAGFVGRVAAWFARVPIVIHTAHAFPFHPYLPPLTRWWYMFLERWAAKCSDLIMVDTYTVRKEGLKAQVTKDQEKIVVVPMGINLEKFSPSPPGVDTLRRHFGFSEQALVVGTVARLVPDKGLECFLHMASEIIVERDDVVFLMVGDGPLRSDLEYLAKDLGVSARVVFAGHRTDIPSVLQIMDLFVLPTLREGFGVVFAEAMAMEKATIGSCIGPVAEVVEEGVTGYLASPTDYKEFAKYALELLADDNKRLKFGKAGRKRVEKHFNEQIMCETIEKHYRRLLVAKGLTI